MSLEMNEAPRVGNTRGPGNATPSRQATESYRKYCPFGREVAEALAAGRYVNTYLFAGKDAWGRAKRRREQHGPGSAMLLPIGDDPRDYRWPPVDAIIVATGDMETVLVERLARALIHDGVRYACLIGDTDTVNAWASWAVQVNA